MVLLGLIHTKNVRRYLQTVDVRRSCLGNPAQDGLGFEGAAVGAENFCRFLAQYKLEAFVSWDM